MSKYCYLFNNGKECAETETKLDFISSISYDDHNLRLDKNNWQWLWCNTSFQGINATKALDHVLGNKGMYSKTSYVPKDKDHITIY